MKPPKLSAMADDEKSMENAQRYKLRGFASAEGSDRSAPACDEGADFGVFLAGGSGKSPAVGGKKPKK